MTDAVRLPDEVWDALAGSPDIGVAEQALPLLTTDGDGQPRAMLLSRAEIATESDAAGDKIFCVLRPSISRTNLRRSRRATLLVITTKTLHAVRLCVARVVEHQDLQGVALSVNGVKADSLGIPLEPIRYIPTEELVRLEHWRTSATVLDKVRHWRP